MGGRHIIVLTTYSGAKTGAAITRALLGARLAACVQVLPIRSTFPWKGGVSRSRETLMLIKARSRDFGRIERVILESHDYEVPEIVSVPIDRGFAGYLAWMDRVTRRAAARRGRARR